MKKCKRCKVTKCLTRFEEDIRYKDNQYPICTMCLEDNYSDTNLAQTRTCCSCEKEKPTVDFKRKLKSVTGFTKICKSCNRDSSAKRKGMLGKVSVKDTKKFLEDKECEGVKFSCKSCEKVSTVKDFYHKRDAGRVYIVTTRCKSCEKFYQTLKTFGIDKHQFVSMMEQQNNCCKICTIYIDDYKKQGYRNHFSIDHCHSTGHVRGLLCDKCNRGLGFFKYNIEYLKKAINYLNS